MTALKPHIMWLCAPQEKGGLAIGPEQTQELDPGLRADPGFPSAILLNISLVPLMPMAAEFHFPAGFLGRPLRKARWWGSGTVI